LPKPADRQSLTVRLAPDLRRRVRALAFELDATIQDLLIAGLNRIFTERGLDPIDPKSAIVPPTRKRK
jgi:hypothetical protein